MATRLTMPLFALCALAAAGVGIGIYAYHADHAGLAARLDGSDVDETLDQGQSAERGDNQGLPPIARDSVTSASNLFKSRDIGSPEIDVRLTANETDSHAKSDIDPTSNSGIEADKDAEPEPTVATETITLPTSRSLADSFEGSGTTGWGHEWRATGSKPGSFESGLQTTTEVAPPPDGGTHSLRQWWHSDLSSWTNEWLVHTFGSDINEGEVFEFEYYQMYDANFDHHNQAVKSIIARNEAGHQEMYIHTWTFGPIGAPMTVNFQQTTDTFFMTSNINGGAYVMPLGEWVHFRWQIKASTQSNGDPRNGYLYGWVNGVKRWEYDGINTIYTGKYHDFNLNSTFNGSATHPEYYGPNQKRYWDSFSVKAVGHSLTGNDR